MPEKIKDVKPPRGLARLGFRLPIWFYRLGLGGLLGKRFLMLTHTGRKSGLQRQTVLEVVQYHPDGNTFVVTAGFGPRSDWYQNVRKQPLVTVQSGGRRWKMQANFLPPEQAAEELLDYYHHHPRALHELAGVMGYRLQDTEADVRALGETLHMVAFSPLER